MKRRRKVSSKLTNQPYQKRNTTRPSSTSSSHMLLCRPPQLSHIPSYHTLFTIADDEQVRNAPRETASHGRSWHHHCNDPSTTAHPSPCQSLGPDLSLKCSVARYAQAAELTKLLESTRGHVEKLNVSDRRDLFVPGTVSTDASRESDQPRSCSPLLAGWKSAQAGFVAHTLVAAAVVPCGARLLLSSANLDHRGAAPLRPPAPASNQRTQSTEPLAFLPPPTPSLRRRP